eukprot:383477_1
MAKYQSDNSEREELVLSDSNNNSDSNKTKNENDNANSYKLTMKTVVIFFIIWGLGRFSNKFINYYSAYLTVYFDLSYSQITHIETARYIGQLMVPICIPIIAVLCQKYKISFQHLFIVLASYKFFSFLSYVWFTQFWYLICTRFLFGAILNIRAIYLMAFLNKYSFDDKHTMYINWIYAS